MKKSVAITAFVIFYHIVLIVLFSMNNDILLKVYSKIGIVNGSFLHIPAFFFLAFLIRLMFTSKLWAVHHPLLWSFFVCMGVAILLEVVQVFIPSRTANLTDFIVDIVGILLYLVVDLYFAKHIKRILK